MRHHIFTMMQIKKATKKCWVAFCNSLPLKLKCNLDSYSIFCRHEYMTFKMDLCDPMQKFFPATKRRGHIWSAVREHTQYTYNIQAPSRLLMQPHFDIWHLWFRLNFNFFTGSLKFSQNQQKSLWMEKEKKGGTIHNFANSPDPVIMRPGLSTGAHIPMVTGWKHQQRHRTKHDH